MDMTFFQQHGYQILRGVIDPQAIRDVRYYLVGEAYHALMRMRRKLGCNTTDELCAAIDAVTQRDDFERVPRDLRLTMSGHFPLKARLNEELWKIPQCPSVRGLLEAALEDDQLFMHMPPTARFVLPGNRHAGVPAHQDVSYNRHMSEFVTMWVPLVPIDHERGGVAVYEGSGEPIERLSDDDAPLEQPAQKFWLRGVDVEGSRKIHEPMQPGDALLLNRWIVHESMPNLSDIIRYSVDYRFFPSRVTSTKHVLDMQTWTVHEPAEAAA